jgi:hypothetical protein
MKELLSLGEIYVSDFIKEGHISLNKKTELKLILDNDGCIRLSESTPINNMFGKYWYRSGTNDSMKKALKDIVDSILYTTKLNSGDIWLDIACNDGTLFNYVPSYCKKIGIDPVGDSFKIETEKLCDLFIQDYFTSEKYKESIYGPKKVKIITSIAVFYDIVERIRFLNDINEVLDDNGLWVLQQSYTPLMIRQLAFDNICHEHYYYYSLTSINNLLKKNGFKIMDCQINDVNGGSFRLYVMKEKANETYFSSQPYRDICKLRIDSLLAYEDIFELESRWTWFEFMQDVNQLKHSVMDFIKMEKRKGKSIWAYGASTKGNTLLQYFGLNSSHIDAIADRSPYKIGLKTIGSNILIRSEEDMRKVHPDYLLILPWHFITEFKERESEYLKSGGSFIVPCPKLQIITNE